MTDNLCTYSNQRGETLVGYLYDELTGDERLAFERHLTSCALCRGELDTLRDVRTDLARWVPPDAAPLAVPAWSAAPAPAVAPRRTPQLREIPIWAQAAAAVLLIGVGAGFANLRVSYTAQGFSVSTGWMAPAPARVSAAPPAPVAEAPKPWRADILSLEQELRGAIDARSAAAVPATDDDAAVVRRVRALVQESEQRQQRELALRLAELARDVQVQRQADLVRIDRNLGLMQNQTGMEVMRTQRQLNSLAQQVSQRP